MKVLFLMSHAGAARNFESTLRGLAERGHEVHMAFDRMEKAKPTDEEMAAAAPDGERLTMTGPAGTMIFCDTSGFHRGGFAKSTPRVLSIWSYVSPEAENRSHRFDVELEGREAELSADARAALA